MIVIYFHCAHSFPNRNGISLNFSLYPCNQAWMYWYSNVLDAWSLIQLYYYLQPVPIYRTIEKRQNVGCQSSLIAVASIWSRIGGPFSLSTDQMEWRKKPIPLGHETSFCLHFGLILTLIERRRNRRSRKVQGCQLIMNSFCEYLDSSTFKTSH